MSIWKRIEKEIENFRENIRDLPVASPVSPAAVRQELERRFPFEKSIDLHEKGLQALKMRPLIYLTSESHHSFNKIARMTGLKIGDLLRDKSAHAGWRIANETPLPVVCFTHPEIQMGRMTTQDILTGIYKRNRVWISETLLGGQEKVLRACITSYLTGRPDIDCLMDELESVRKAPDRVRK